MLSPIEKAAYTARQARALPGIWAIILPRSGFTRQRTKPMSGVQKPRSKGPSIEGMLRDMAALFERDLANAAMLEYIHCRVIMMALCPA